MINATVSVTDMLLVFLNSIFDIKRYNGACLSLADVPRPMKIITFTDESEVKNKSIFSIHGV